MAKRSDRAPVSPRGTTVSTPSSPGVIAHSHLEIETAAPERPLAILFADSDRRVRDPHGRLRVAGCNRILVRPAGKGWYHDGVTGLGATIEETAAALRKIIATMQPSHVAMFGASTGGYAAIAFGSLLQVDRIVA